MSDTTNEIDLGLHRHPPPVRPRWSGQVFRRGWPRMRRAAVAAATVAGLLAVIAPDPVTARSPLAPIVVRDATAEEFTVHGDLLFISGRPESAGNRQVWSAHSLPDGAYLWTTPHQPVGVVPGGHALTVSFDRGLTRTVALDQQTGQPQWVSYGHVSLVAGTGLGVVVRGERFEGPGDSPPNLRHQEVRVLDLASGEVRWSAETSGDGIRVVVGETAVVTVEVGGAARVHDLHSGDVRASGQIAELSGARSGMIVDGTLVVMEPDPGNGFAAVGYDLDSLAPQWQVDIDEEVYLDHSAIVQPEGAYWATGDQLHLLDPRGGQLLSLPRPRLPAGGLRWWGDTAVLADSSGRPRDLRDRLTGRSLGQLSGWHLVESDGQTGQLLLIRPGGTATLLARLDPATGRVQHLGAHQDVLSDCRAVDEGLVCRSGVRIGLWRWR